MHLYCQGSGSPTVVLIAGLGGGVDSWRRVQPGLSLFTRVCSFDRLTRKLYPDIPVHTTRTTVTALHALLRKAHVAPPYVLVGASIGGWDTRLYLGMYRHQVAGVVFVDAGHPDAYTRLAALLPPGRRLFFDEEIQANPQHLENLDIQRSSAQVRAVKTFGSIPLIVLVHGRVPTVEGHHMGLAATRRLEAAWREMQAELRSLSTNNMEVIALASDHHIALRQPALVIAAVHAELQAIRRTGGRLESCEKAFHGLAFDGLCV